MNPIQTLPANYSLAWDVNLKRDKLVNVLLQVVGTVWLVLVGIPLWIVVRFLRPELGIEVWLSSDDLLGALLGFLLAIVIAITLHELVHGAFFWWFSKSKPKFGFGPGYAYASMPDWYFPKYQYLVIGLSPLVALTVLGLFLMPFLPEGLVMPFFWGMLFNAGGAIGDVYICLRVAREAGNILVRDVGDGLELFRPGA